jgi:hypothetical protein
LLLIVCPEPILEMLHEVFGDEGKAFVRSNQFNAGPLRYWIDPKEGHYQLDHRVPLSLGGSNDESNLWPEAADTQPCNARAKDRLEDRIHAQVCSGKREMSLQDGQAVLLGDWTQGYRRVFGEGR